MTRWTASWMRLALPPLILLAFGRVMWGLDAKALWWDESLSVQRAEQALWPLLQGRLTMVDGVSSLLTIDQHPFFYFLLQGMLMRAAGSSEFAVRFVSAMAATLLVPAIYVLGRLLVRRVVLPLSAPFWCSLLAAVSPFFLWYGQEARPYALWAMLTVLATYVLLRTVERPTWRWWLGYGAIIFMLLTTHYYAVFVLPIHALILVQWLWGRNRSLGIALAGSMLVVGTLIGVVAAYQIVVRQGGGANFPTVRLKTLAPDLLNAFSLGLSVDITRVWWLDLVFGVLLVLGAGWSLRSKQSWREQGWVPVALVLLPAGVVMLINRFQPVYMNARHLSLIGGGFILLTGGGLAVVTQWQRWVGVALAALLLVGAGYSTVNYFTVEEYAKDDLHRLGEYLDGRIMPGDLVIIKPPFSWRHFAYYLPNADMTDPQVRANGIDVFGMPLLHKPWDESVALLQQETADHHRTWFLVSGTHPYDDLENQVDNWLDDNLFRLDDITFFSHSSLHAKLYLQAAPVIHGPPGNRGQRTDILYGDLIRLYAYDPGPYVAPEIAVPVTLYWQTAAKTDRRYKYILRLERSDGNGGWMPVAVTEREPYDGVIPTNFWDTDITIEEYSELSPPLPDLTGTGGDYRLTVQVYDAETLEKLPVTSSAAGEIDADGVTAVLPFQPATSEEVTQ